MRDPANLHLTSDRPVFATCGHVVDDAPLPRDFSSLRQVADAVDAWIHGELARRETYECNVAKSTWQMLDVKWINAQEITTLRHEQRTFCDRLWLMAPARVEMMTNNTAPGVLRYVRGGSTKLAAYMFQSASDAEKIRQYAEQIARECVDADKRLWRCPCRTHDHFVGVAAHASCATAPRRAGC